MKGLAFALDGSHFSHMDRKSQNISFALSLLQILAGFILSYTAIHMSGVEAYGAYLAFTAVVTIATGMLPFGGPDLIMREISKRRISGQGRSEIGRFITRFWPVLPAMASAAAFLSWLLHLKIGVDLLTSTGILLCLAVSQYIAGMLRGLGKSLWAQALALISPPLVMSAVIAVAPELFDLYQAQLVSTCLTMTLMSLILAGAWRSLPVGVPCDDVIPYRSLAGQAAAIMALGIFGVLNSSFDIFILGWLGTSADVVAFQLAVQAGLIFVILRGNAGYMATSALSEWLLTRNNSRLARQCLPMIRRITRGTMILFPIMAVLAYPVALQTSGSSDVAWRALLAFIAVGGAFALTAGFCVNGQISLHLGKPRIMLKWQAVSFLVNLITAPLMAIVAGAPGVGVSLFASVVIFNIGLRQDVLRISGLDLSPIAFLKRKKRQQAEAATAS